MTGSIERLILRQAAAQFSIELDMDIDRKIL